MDITSLIFLLVFSFHVLLSYLLELFYLIFIFFTVCSHMCTLSVLLQLVLFKIQLDTQASLLISQIPKTVGRKEEQALRHRTQLLLNKSPLSSSTQIHIKLSPQVTELSSTA